MRGYFAEGRTPWETVTGDVENRTRTADSEGECVIPYTLKIRSGCEGGGKGALIQEDKSATLSTLNDQYLFQPVIDGHILDDQGGSQISVRSDGKSPTLRAEMHGNVPCVMDAAGFCTEHSAKSRSIGYEEEVSPTLRAGVTPAVMYQCYDARGNGDGKVAPTITGDHNNRVTDYTAVAVKQIYTIDGDKLGKAERAGGSGLGVKESDKMYTLTAKDVHGVAIPIHDQATRFSGKRGENYDGKGNGLGVGNPGDPMNTLTGGDRHAVMYWDGSQVAGTLTANNANGAQRMPDKENFNCVIEKRTVHLASGKPVTGSLCASGYEKLGAQEMFSGDYTVIEEEPVVSIETFHCTTEEEKTTTLKARDYKDPVCVAYGVDCRNATEYEEITGAVQASMNHNLNSNGVVRVQYIVRRLTPTECARLQGFADGWAHPDTKSEFTDEEYEFWLNVRNTHAEINGKQTKQYTKDQMLTWYNKLHTDSSEYKLWGNGIALPCALYVMQGIADCV